MRAWRWGMREEIAQQAKRNQQQSTSACAGAPPRSAGCGLVLVCLPDGRSEVDSEQMQTLALLPRSPRSPWSLVERACQSIPSQRGELPVHGRPFGLSNRHGGPRAWRGTRWGSRSSRHGGLRAWRGARWGKGAQGASSEEQPLLPQPSLPTPFPYDKVLLPLLDKTATLVAKRQTACLL